MKTGIIIYEEMVEKYDVNRLCYKVEEYIDRLSNVGVNTFLIILPEKKRYSIVNKIVNKYSRSNIEIIFREIYGDSGGGGIVSLIPFAHHGEKILIIDPTFHYSFYIYEYFFDAAEREEHSTLFISSDKSPPFVALYRDRVTYVSDVKDKLAKYSYAGAAALNYNFFSKVNELISIYPDLHTSDLSRVFNLFLSKGGVLKANYLSPDEWERESLL